MEALLKKIRETLLDIEVQMRQNEDRFAAALERVHPSNRRPAQNLLHYLTLRNLDIRHLQDQLHAFGLSSLASSESHIRGQVLAILNRLGARIDVPEEVYTSETARQSLRKRVSELFGARESGSIPYIMVTLDGRYGDDYFSIKNLLQSGMNVARINCAHDDAETWLRLIQQVRKASKNTGLPCKVYMDLAGPKIRTVLLDRDRLPVEEGKKLRLTDPMHLSGFSGKNTLACTIPGIAAQLKKGDRVLIDDGLIAAEVVKPDPVAATIQITRISAKKPRIKAEKGLNFPDSDLQVSALTDFDRQCLPFIRQHADMVGYSFVRSVADLSALRAALQKGKKQPALILKIETLEAVRHLPDLLFSGLEDERVGVMIARGDLAVEIGFERLSEIQEEILWLCEAAHIPVIWATQVLENLNKSGIATRSEITDAAHAAHADCVMINKGDFIFRVIDTLKDILHRSGGHHIKKRYTFRPLAIAGRYLAS